MSAAPPVPALHPSATPDRRRAALLTALRAGRVPGRLLYESPAQARRWLDYHAAWSPSRTDAGLRSLYAAGYAAAAAALAADAVLAVGLGCGGGSKDAALLAALCAHDATTTLHYAPVDGSPALVREAAALARAHAPAAALHPLVADLAAAPALEPWLAAALPQAHARLLTCFGMLPNMDPVAFPHWLAALLRPGDALLVSANLSPADLAADGARILAQYDNAPARDWYAGALAELGLPPSAYALDVAAEPLARLGPGVWRIAVRAQLHPSLNVAATLRAEGETIALAPGAELAVFHSLRYTEPAAQALLRGAGLAVRERWVGAGGEEGVFLCTRA